MRYTLTAEITVSAYCQVEAKSKEEAIEKAKELPPELSFTGSGNTALGAWLVEEADGEPLNIKVCE